MIPIQYSGAAYVNRLKPNSEWSVVLPRRVAATTPSHDPSNVAMSVPVPTSSSVHGSASLISFHTGSRVRWLTPKSSRARVADVVGELPEQRLVEPVVVLQLLDLLRGRPREVRELGGGITHHPEEEEVEDDHERERHQRRGDLPREPASAHRSSSSGSALRPRRILNRMIVPIPRTTTTIRMMIPVELPLSPPPPAPGVIVSSGS